MATTSSKAFELLTDLAYDNPRPFAERDEQWIRLDNFDPQHGLSELNYAQKMRWIERDGPIRMRLTAIGRKRLGKG